MHLASRAACWWNSRGARLGWLLAKGWMAAKVRSRAGHGIDGFHLVPIAPSCLACRLYQTVAWISCGGKAGRNETEIPRRSSSSRPVAEELLGGRPGSPPAGATARSDHDSSGWRVAVAGGDCGGNERGPCPEPDFLHVLYREVALPSVLQFRHDHLNRVVECIDFTMFGGSAVHDVSRFVRCFVHLAVY